MTNNEAIEVIKLALAQVEWDYPMDYAVAFDMAIKALEQEPTTKNDLGVDKTFYEQIVEYCNEHFLVLVEKDVWEDARKALTTKNDLALIHTEGLDEEIRCTMCTNHMKSNRGCDGSCVVNKDMYKAVMDAIERRIQPTTKNDLGVDCIDRKMALDTMQMKWKKCSSGDDAMQESIDAIREMPSVTPQEPKTGHCRDCKWWKDSDGAYRRGVRAESQCPINRREVYEGNGYCFLYDPQESEDNK